MHNRDKIHELLALMNRETNHAIRENHAGEKARTLEILANIKSLLDVAVKLILGDVQ